MKIFSSMLALTLSAPAFAVCTVISEAGDEPVFDIQTVGMSSDADTIHAEIAMGEPVAAYPAAFFNVYLTAADGQSNYYMRAASNSDQFSVYEYGTFTIEIDPNTGGETRSRSYVGDISGSIDGSLVNIDLPADLAVGLSGTITVDVWAGVAREVVPAGIGAGGTAFDTTDKAAYTLGDSCGRNGELKTGAESGLNADGRYFSAGAGSPGWLSLLVGLLGLRRRRHA